MKTPLLLLAIAASCMAQQPTVWYEFDYMKALPAGAAAYTKAEMEIYKPVHQDQVAKGQILGWALYSVRFAGTKSEYNYVTLTMFTDYAKVENGRYNDEQRKRIAASGVQAFALRDLVKTDILGQFASVGTMNAPWIGVTFTKSKPGMVQDRRNDEAKLWKPLHDAQLKAGAKYRKGWAAALVRWPSGENVEYDIISADAFDNFAAFDGSGAGNTGFETQSAEANKTTALHGNTVKRELWQLIASTDPAK